MEWGYTKVNGPETWHSKCPIARTGTRQSPIDVKTADVKLDQTLGELSTKYINKDLVTIENTGASFMISVQGHDCELSGGPLSEKYALLQIHAHWGNSEHHVNGKPFDAELHLVHWNKSKYDSPQQAMENPDGLAVVGVLIKAGSNEHSELDKIIKMLPKIKEKGSKVPLTEEINPTNFFPASKNYWTYDGSLTTPPLLECVTWILFQEPIKATPEQLSSLCQLHTKDDENKDIKLADNFRPPVPVNNRLVRTNFAPEV